MRSGLFGRFVQLLQDRFVRDPMVEIRRQYLRSRAPRENEQFCADIACPAPLRDIVCDLRTVLGRICSIDPRFIRPDDGLVELVQIMDWGRKRGWLWDSDYGAFKPWQFQLALKQHLRSRASREFLVSLENSQLEDYLPPFSRFAPSESGQGDTPEQAGNWVLEAARTIHTKLPLSWPKCGDVAMESTPDT